VAREDAEAAFRRDEAREQAIVDSVRMAQDRGELVSVHQALRDGGVGRTPQQVVEWMSAQADLQDMREAAQRRKQLNAFEQSMYGDTTAPTPAQIADGEKVARAQGVAHSRVAARKATDRRTMQLARSAVRLFGGGS
jgi:hypothetical protein